MDNLLKVGRINYAVGLAGLGIQQFFYPGFRPMFIPLKLPDVWPLVYLSSIALIFVAISILSGFKARPTCLACGGFFFALVVLVHLPARLSNSPENLAFWTDALKLLTFSGGAFLIAGTFSGYDQDAKRSSFLFALLEKLIPMGRFFFGIMLTIFGIDHFLYAEFVAMLVPEWIPGHSFWTYFSAVALIGSGLAFMLKFQLKWVGILTGIMLFSWFLMLHIPRAIAMPEVMNGNEITSVLQALSFSGIAFVLGWRASEKGV